MKYNSPFGYLLLATCSVLFSCQSLFSQTILLNDFTDWLAVNPNGGFAASSWDNGGTYQVVQQTGYISIEPVSGGDPLGDGYLYADVSGTPPINLSTYDYLSVSIQLQLTNTSTSFSVAVSDSFGTEIGSALFAASLFNTSSFTQATALISWTIPASRNDVGGIYIYADSNAASIANFDVTQVEATTIPEPSTWLLLAGGLTTVVVFRRRNRV